MPGNHPQTDKSNHACCGSLRDMQIPAALIVPHHQPPVQPIPGDQNTAQHGQYSQRDLNGLPQMIKPTLFKKGTNRIVHAMFQIKPTTDRKQDEKTATDYPLPPVWGSLASVGGACSSHTAQHCDKAVKHTSSDRKKGWPRTCQTCSPPFLR